jgi:hypothetical protein
MPLDKFGLVHLVIMEHVVSERLACSVCKVAFDKPVAKVLDILAAARKMLALGDCLVDFAAIGKV